MDSVNVDRIITGIKARQDKIRLPGCSDPGGALRDAIIKAPVVFYCFGGCSFIMEPGTPVLCLKYTNEHISPSDVCFVRSETELHRMLEDCAGRYKRFFVFVTESDRFSSSFSWFNDNIQAYYPNLYTINCTGFGIGGYPYHYYTVEFIYRIGPVKLKMMEMGVNQEVERLAKELFLPGMPPEVKVYLAHNYLASTVTYMKEIDNPLKVSYTQSAYGALVKKQCVCQGFAEAFYRLMSAAGIECYIIRGVITSRVSEPSRGRHAWNILTCSDEYFHLDVTFDNIKKEVRFNYFCMSDIEMMKERTWERKYYKPCSGGQPVLEKARAYVAANRTRLLSQGIPASLLL